MTTTLNLPGHEVLISDVDAHNARLSVRLICDYHPSADPAAYIVEIQNPDYLEDAVAFLKLCKEGNEYLYVAQVAEGVAFSTESGDSHIIHCHEASSTPTTFNESELREVVKRVYAWYLAENEASRISHSRIESAKNLLAESARRIDIKASTHGNDGTAATLYSQQQSLIRRVLDALQT